MSTELKVPKSVCWNITSRCNDNCEFCYREQNQDELSLEQQKIVINKVSKAGIKKLTFAGGEPLLLKHINDLVLYAKGCGLLVGVTSNGILLDENVEEYKFLLENLNRLTFSLDGSNNGIQAKMSRNESHAARVLDLLEFAMLYDQKQCRMKLNTLVSKINSNDILNIAALVKKVRVERWKLFQFSPIRGNAIDYQIKFDISDDEFKKVVNDVTEALREQEIIISESGRQDLESAYFVIFPNGEVRLSHETGESVLGNMLDDEVEAIWNQNKFHKVMHQERTIFLGY